MIPDVEIARQRANILFLVREFFRTQGFLEIDPPALSAGLVPEPEIAPFSTEWILPWGPRNQLWLVPSPEVHLKKLLADGYPSLFSISKCYRNAENLGPIHNPEFTMLEWYEKNRDEQDLLGTMEGLFHFLGKSYPLPGLLTPPFRKWDLVEAFQKFAGVDWTRCSNLETLRKEAEKSGTVHPAESWEDLWHWLLIDRVEPHFPKDASILVTGWPSRIPTQAAVAEDGVRSLRWELVCGGVELVNACKENIDPYRRDEINRLAATHRGPLGPLPVRDHDYDQALARLGPVSGAAMGLDRLIMLLLGKKSLREVIFFPFFDRLRSHE